MVQKTVSRTDQSKEQLEGGRPRLGTETEQGGANAEALATAATVHVSFNNKGGRVCFSKTHGDEKELQKCIHQNITEKSGGLG